MYRVIKFLFLLPQLLLVLLCSLFGLVIFVNKLHYIFSVCLKMIVGQFELCLSCILLVFKFFYLCFECVVAELDTEHLFLLVYKFFHFLVF